MDRTKRDEAEITNSSSDDLEDEYRALSTKAAANDRAGVKAGLERLLKSVAQPALAARIHNDLGVLTTLEGNHPDASEHFQEACLLAPDWNVPVENQRRLSARMPNRFNGGDRPPERRRSTRVAVVSLLFNWPSTGGGTIHTAELGKFLSSAGYETRHIYARYDGWGLGCVSEPTLSPSEELGFSNGEWTVSNVQSRFRAALRTFDPDFVIVTDTWNSKPILARAAEDYPFFLRIAAQECLCPLNNVRLLYDAGRISSCPKHQLATPEACCRCVAANGRFSGQLHQVEREWVDYGSRQYDEELRWSFAQAAAVLAVNPLVAAMVSPYAKKVCVVPSGFDPSRFVAQPESRESKPILRILFAGLVDELMKGFPVALDACARLWSERQDFELVATADPPGQPNGFTRFIGWQSQADLPHVMSESDILVFPTVAEEALGRTAVEAMAAGLPVVASRIGGLQFTVVDGATGLLFEPGNSEDLCLKLKRLMDDAALRKRFGEEGRRRFDEQYTWDAILKRHYVPLLGEPTRVDR